VRLLFVKDALAWPRAVGHDVHGFSMMQALGRLGHEVALLTRTPAAPEALDGLSLRFAGTLDTYVDPTDPVALTSLQERFLSYWGIDAASLGAAGRAAAVWGADAVIAVGLDALPCLAGVNGSQRVWYAADEAAWHHLSQIGARLGAAWGHCKQAAINGLYERAFAPCLDRVWVVSEKDQRAMRWVTQVREVDVIANGVDGDHYRPHEVAQQLKSCAFWGRLDFGPNVQALDWFCRRVWPLLRREVPDATFAVYGRCPTAQVRELTGAAGIVVTADLPDLRAAVCRHPVAVLPFVSGGGIKNKLLEAASLGLAIVGSPRACNGLQSEASPPLVQADAPCQWVDAVVSLWADDARRRRLGAEARAWVLSHHTWEAAARRALASLKTQESVCCSVPS